MRAACCVIAKKCPEVKNLRGGTPLSRSEVKGEKRGDQPPDQKKKKRDGLKRAEVF